MRLSKIHGPAIMITAAFIGPGTILIASQAGAKHGFALLWVVLFATITTIILQEMAGRLGIVTGSGFGQAITGYFSNPWLRAGLVSLILVAILLGNSAYQTGNLLGAKAGVEPFFFAFGPKEIESSHFNWPVLVIGLLAGGLIVLGKFEWLRTILTVLVGLMSLMFVLAAILSQPQPAEILYGLIPSLPPNSAPLALGLIGTTVVPYNLFLHASAAANRWPENLVRKTIDKERAIRDSFKDTVLAVSVGGLVTAGILITAAMAFHPTQNPAIEAAVDLQKVGDISHQLRPILGQWATLFFGLGLFAAGFTSAITAPVAAGLATAGCFGWPNQLQDWRVKSTALGVLLTGSILAVCFGKAPAEAILTAQIANGFILPLLAMMLLVLTNRLKLMNRFINGRMQNIIGTFVVLIVLAIAANQLSIAVRKLW
jgi:manganese transport protein